ncbi:MAG: benzoyl-CoA 2,3-epoxidase subunit BoxA [Rhodobiaceae bacterium]|nr:benzoyl-CoA 2,3-epoxidase subunit BoxA [Rhodobiaceae bacterium]
MNKPLKQHLIDPEICIRCYTCEMTCPIEAITHDDTNVVVDAGKCDFCMACIPVCPTGSIDEWRVVAEPYSIAEQLSWDELPEQQDIGAGAGDVEEAFDETVAALLAEAHKGVGGKARAPSSAAKPTINLYTRSKPAKAVVQGSYRLTSEESGAEVRHIILDLGGQPFPVMEGQSIGIIAPGADENGNPHLPRLYSISSPRDGERPGYNNISLTVKREDGGICSNYVCDLKIGDEVLITGPFGATFLMPDDPSARLLMVCTGTGSAPFRAFTMRRQRVAAAGDGDMVLFFGARAPDSLPYFGPLNKIPGRILKKHLVFSRIPGAQKEYVQDRMMVEQEVIAEMLQDPRTHIYVCGLRGMEEGVEKAFLNIAESTGVPWESTREVMCGEGRYHVETY